MTRRTFSIDIEPVPTPRGRAGIQGGFARVYNPVQYSNWKGMAALIIKHRCREMYQGAVTVTLDVIATKARTSKLKHPTADVDNYAKAALDAITQATTVWLDDKQAVRLLVEKRFADRQTDEEPRIDVSISPWQPRGVERAGQLVYEACQGLSESEVSTMAAEMLERWASVLNTTNK